MKTIILLTLILFITSFCASAQNLDKMPVEKRNVRLISIAKKAVKKYAPDYGFEIVESGINVQADVEMAAVNLAGKVDCINNLTDNTVVNALQTVINAANQAGIWLRSRTGQGRLCGFYGTGIL